LLTPTHTSIQRLETDPLDDHFERLDNALNSSSSTTIERTGPLSFKLSSKENDRVDLLQFDNYEELNGQMHSVETLFKKNALTKEFVRQAITALKQYKCSSEEVAMVALWKKKLTKLIR
jgi:hypothetical protein